MARNDTSTFDYKTVLRDLWDSEELNIDSPYGQALKSKVETLCRDGDAMFERSFVKVREEVDKDVKNNEAKKEQPYFKEMYIFLAKDAPVLLKELSSDHNDPILWQMIVERLFTKQHEVSIPVYTPVSPRELTVIEENAIYYAAGYVVRKLINRYRKNDDRKSREFLDALYDMLGEDQGNFEAYSSFMDYVKVWTQTTDRGGLMHVSLDTFRCFSAIELVIYELIKKGRSREEVVGEALNDESVKLLWMLIADLPNEAESFELLNDVVSLWYTLRGFSVAGKMFEEYKQANKTNVRGTKGVRKELH